MTPAGSDSSALKQAVKEAVAEVLQEQRGLFYDILAEVLEERALAEAIREGRETRPVSHAAVLRVLPHKA